MTKMWTKPKPNQRNTITPLLLCDNEMCVQATNPKMAYAKSDNAIDKTRKDTRDPSPQRLWHKSNRLKTECTNYEAWMPVSNFVFNNNNNNSKMMRQSANNNAMTLTWDSQQKNVIKRCRNSTTVMLWAQSWRTRTITAKAKSYPGFDEKNKQSLH